MLKELHHGGVCYNDFDDAVRWYEKIGFRTLFRTDAMEGGKPLKMVWIKAGKNIVLELLEQADKPSAPLARKKQNPFSWRVDDVDEVARLLEAEGIDIEVGSFATTLEFDRPLSAEDSDLLEKHGNTGLKLKIMFFRGITGERFEMVRDSLDVLETA